VKIVLVISSMGPGGAERVVSRLSRYWAQNGRNIVLLTLSSEPSFYELSDQVECVGLDLMSRSENKWRSTFKTVERIWVLRKTLKSLDPDVIISFMDKTNTLVLFATRGLGVPVVVSERIYPGSQEIGFEWESIRRVAYRFADRLVVITDAMRREFERRGYKNIEVIPNPAVPAPVNVSSAAPKGGRCDVKTILAAGRLEHQKGFDLLLESFSTLHKSYPDWQLVIVGEGALRPRLMKLADELGISGRLRLPGVVDNLPDHLACADIFVLSSRFEGFPNVLVEAMAAGTAVVATDCLSGPREIIRNNENGLLVPVDNARGLARALDLLMSDISMRQRLGTKARNVSDTFSLDGVMRKWNRIVDEAIAA